MPPAASFVRSR